MCKQNYRIYKQTNLCGIKKFTLISYVCRYMKHELLTYEDAKSMVSKSGQPVSLKNELENQTFGKIKVLPDELMFKRYGKKKSLIIFLKCKCDCGNERYVPKSSIKYGKIKNCGCESNIGLNLIGERFGKLIVKSLNKSNRIRKFWDCECDCGKSVIVTGKNLRKGYTKSCGCLRGNKYHKNWKGYEDISSVFFSNIITSAISRKIHFDITIEYLWDLFIQQDRKCALSGVDLTFSKIRKDTKSKSVSIDRIDSNIGYIKGNVQWVHKTVNIMKNKLKEEDFIFFCNKISQHNKNKKDGKMD